MSWLEQIESYDDLFETRNSKLETNRNDKRGKLQNGAQIPLSRAFVSDFDIRISDFSFKVWLISLSVCANG